MGSVSLIWPSKILALSSFSATSVLSNLVTPFSFFLFFFFFNTVISFFVLKLSKRAFWLLLFLGEWWLWVASHSFCSFLTGKQTRSCAELGAKSSAVSVLRGFLVSCSRRLLVRCVTVVSAIYRQKLKFSSRVVFPALAAQLIFLSTSWQMSLKVSVRVVMSHNQCITNYWKPESLI